MTRALLGYVTNLHVSYLRAAVTEAEALSPKLERRADRLYETAFYIANLLGAAKALYRAAWAREDAMKLRIAAQEELRQLRRSL